MTVPAVGTPTGLAATGRRTAIVVTAATRGPPPQLAATGAAPDQTVQALERSTVTAATGRATLTVPGRGDPPRGAVAISVTTDGSAPTTANVRTEELMAGAGSASVQAVKSGGRVRGIATVPSTRPRDQGNAAPIAGTTRIIDVTTDDPRGTLMAGTLADRRNEDGANVTIVALRGRASGDRTAPVQAAAARLLLN